MPDLVIELCSEPARASGPNAVTPAFKNSKSTDQTLYTPGMNKLAEIAYESGDEDKKPVVRKTPTRTWFGDIMA